MADDRPALSESMTETDFDHGYWYAGELRAFAVRIGVPSASRLRKDELEAAVKDFIRTGEATKPTGRRLAASTVRDIDLGLRLDLPVVHYVGNRTTKDFIEQEASKIQPGFRHKPGTRYLLNRWREEQLTRGTPITYGDLVRQALVLNETKTGPLRLEHGRYVNFVSDYLAANPRATTAEAASAWREVKELDAPKTYEAWSRHTRRAGG